MASRGMILGVLSILLASAALAASGSADPIRIVPVGIDEDGGRALAALLLDRESVKRSFEGHRIRVLGTELGGGMDVDPGKDVEGATRGGLGESLIRLHVYDYTVDRLFVLTGNGRSGGIRMRSSDETPAPSPEEWAEASEILKTDAFFGANGGAAAWKTYEAMPGVIRARDIDSSSEARDRIITVGILPSDASSPFRHEIVAVNLSHPSVIRFPDRAPPTAIAGDATCAPPNAGQGTTGRGVAGQADVIVSDGAGGELWRFRAVRPSASSGFQGSGIDLRNIFYKGKRVLSQLHVPIMNVKYDRDRCGPYRDWQYAETPFKAKGKTLASGILRATEKPETIFESGSDRGNFRGVAIYRDGTETVLVTEVAAGWYRYKAEYRFDDDGTIRPRWGFTAVQDSCTCNPHHHHVYWRMDFELGDGKNVVQVKQGDGWKTIGRELAAKRDPDHSTWRVMDPATGAGYEIDSGESDGQANAFARDDFWVLRYHSGEIDDQNAFIGAPINIQPFVNGESVEGQDIVFWYAAHFNHFTDDDRDGREMRGPTLRPVAGF